MIRCRDAVAAPAKQGFSLVELSIVLVILGLLVGGILSGQSLIRAAELRSTATQYQKFYSATMAFRDKYFALPGDMTNATSFWGEVSGVAATCFANAGTGTQTCNGDGDGRVEYTAATSPASNEHFRFWQHLANAGLIEGQYDGITHGANDISSTAANSPTGKISSTLWIVMYYGTVSGNTNSFDGVYNNSFGVGGFIADQQPINAFLKPEELWNIDVKLDDGKPAIGKVVVRAYPTLLSACTTTVANSGATLTADYLLTSTVAACSPTFRDQF